MEKEEVKNFADFIFKEALNKIYPPEKAWKKLQEDIEHNSNPSDKEKEKFIDRYLDIYDRITIRDDEVSAYKQVSLQGHDFEPWESKVVEFAKDINKEDKLYDTVLKKADSLYRWSSVKDEKGNLRYYDTVKTFDELLNEKMSPEVAKDLSDYLKREYDHRR